MQGKIKKRKKRKGKEEMDLRWRLIELWWQEWRSEGVGEEEGGKENEEGGDKGRRNEEKRRGGRRAAVVWRLAER